MRRSLAVIRARRTVRRWLDMSSFGPSSAGRLCFALVLCAVLFFVSLGASLAINDPPGYAVAQAGSILVVAFLSLAFLVLGPGDQRLDSRHDQLITYLPQAQAAWVEYQKQRRAERLRKRQNRIEQEKREKEERQYKPSVEQEKIQPDRSGVEAIPIHTRSETVAGLLEFLPGMFLHIFGVGHMYAGNIGTGFLMMFGGWFLALCEFLPALVLWHRVCDWGLLLARVADLLDHCGGECGTHWEHCHQALTRHGLASMIATVARPG